MAEDKTKAVTPTKTSATSSSTALAPAPSPEGSLSRYLAEIRKYPILEAQEENEQAQVEEAQKAAAHEVRARARALRERDADVERDTWLRKQAFYSGSAFTELIKAVETFAQDLAAKKKMAEKGERERDSATDDKKEDSVQLR